MIKILLLFSSGVFLIRTEIDMLIGTGCIILSLLLIFKKSVADDSDFWRLNGLTLSTIFMFWIEMSLFLRAYLYCYKGYFVPLSGYRQMDLAIDALLIESYPPGYWPCTVLRWFIILTAMQSLRLLFKDDDKTGIVYHLK